MVEGALWRRWVFFYIPLTAFIVALLFPFYWMIVTTVRPDSALYRPWNAPNYAPFWTAHPTLVHIKDLLSDEGQRRYIEEQLARFEAQVAAGTMQALGEIGRAHV